MAPCLGPGAGLCDPAASLDPVRSPGPIASASRSGGARGSTPGQRLIAWTPRPHSCPGPGEGSAYHRRGAGGATHSGGRDGATWRGDPKIRGEPQNPAPPEDGRCPAGWEVGGSGPLPPPRMNHRTSARRPGGSAGRGGHGDPPLFLSPPPQRDSPPSAAPAGPSYCYRSGSEAQVRGAQVRGGCRELESQAWVRQRRAPNPPRPAPHLRPARARLKGPAPPDGLRAPSRRKDSTRAGGAPWEAEAGESRGRAQPGHLTTL